MTTSAASLCPPTPPAIGQAAQQAAASRTAANEAAHALDVARYDRPPNRRLAKAYTDHLSEAQRDEQQLHIVMQDFGRYLYRRAVRPEHIVICARDATEIAFVNKDLFRHRLAEQVVRWTIEGYYLERASPRP